VANDFNSKYFNNGTFLTKFDIFRVEHEEKRKHGKQQKRNENLGKRKSDKKDKMKKLAIKKGRIVPGFR
jgi:hypothetical protein